MKKIIVMFIGISVVIFLLFGCDVMGITIESRISSFESDLNFSDRTELYTHFHPDTTSYNQIKDPEFFEATPLATIYKPIHFSNLSEQVDIGNGQKQVTADFSNSSYSDTCTFVMEQSGLDWLIRRFTVDSFQIWKTTNID